MLKGWHMARIMPRYNSDSHSRHQNVCNRQLFLSLTTCVCTVLQDVVELEYTPLNCVSLVREPQFVLHVLANPLSELDWQVLEHRVLVIRILQPYTVRRH